MERITSIFFNTLVVLFFAGICGSFIAVIMTFVDDARTLFGEGDKPPSAKKFPTKDYETTRIHAADTSYQRYVM